MSTDFETQQQTIETAAEREAHYWKGKALHPFSILRQFATQRITKENDGAFERATLIVYLCTLEPLEIDRVRTDEEIEAFRLKMAEWLDGEGVTLSNRGDVIEVANAIWEEMDAARFTLAKQSGKPSPTEPAPPNG